MKPTYITIGLILLLILIGMIAMYFLTSKEISHEELGLNKYEWHTDESLNLGCNEEVVIDIINFAEMLKWEGDAYLRFGEGVDLIEYDCDEGIYYDEKLSSLVCYNCDSEKQNKCVIKYKKEVCEVK